jgi:CheY-like chemotaxis protein
MTSEEDPQGKPHCDASGRFRSGRSILVLEDNVLLSKTIGELLELEGWKVTLCPDGPAAIQVAVQGCFDVVLIDFAVPGIRGHIVTETLRLLLPHARIIGTSFQDRTKEFLAAGADGFLLKPFDVSEVRRIADREGRGTA